MGMCLFSLLFFYYRVNLFPQVRNVAAYNKVYRRVQPKREKLGQATAKLDAVNVSLQALRDKVALLDAENHQLTETFEQAMQDKNKYVAN